MSSAKRSRSDTRRSFLRFADPNYNSDDSDSEIPVRDLASQVESLRTENAAMLVAGRQLEEENSVMRSAGLRLEEKVRDLVSELSNVSNVSNVSKVSKVDAMEAENRSLMSEIQSLKTQLNRMPDPNTVQKLKDRVNDLSQDNTRLRREVSEMSLRIKELEPVTGYVCRKPYDSGNATMRDRVSACERTDGVPSSFDDVKKVPGGRFKQKQTCTENCFFK